MEEETEEQALRKLARQGYEAYARHQDWRAYNGSPVPQWDNVREDIKVAWEYATMAIVNGA